MHVFKTCAARAGVRVLRFLHPRATRLWRALQRADADIYIQRTADADTGLVAAWCRRRSRRFMYCVASEFDCVRDLPHLSTRHERLLYRYGLRRADRVIAQTRDQQRLLRDEFGLEAHRVPNCCEDPLRDAGDAATPAPDAPPRVLWLGRMTQEKRLEWFLDMARRCPEFQFDVMGAPLVRTATRARAGPTTSRLVLMLTPTAPT